MGSPTMLAAMPMSHDLVSISGGLRSNKTTSTLMQHDRTTQLRTTSPCPFSAPFVIHCSEIGARDRHFGNGHDYAGPWRALYGIVVVKEDPLQRRMVVSACRTFTSSFLRSDCVCHLFLSLPVARVLVYLSLLHQEETWQKHAPETLQIVSDKYGAAKRVSQGAWGNGGEQETANSLGFEVSKPPSNRDMGFPSVFGVYFSFCGASSPF